MILEVFQICHDRIADLTASLERTECQRYRSPGAGFLNDLWKTLNFAVLNSPPCSEVERGHWG